MVQPPRPDTVGVNECEWTFRRAGERLTLERRENGREAVLTVAGGESSRCYAFPNLDALTRFQYDMEAFLVRTGWTLVAFSPERRGPIDRRTFPRETNDRRRWWTDAHSSGR